MLENPIHPSRKAILEHLLTEDKNAVQLEGKLDKSLNTIRSHLEVLEEREYVESYFKKASKGRPKKLFRLTDKGREILAPQCKTFLKSLVKDLMGEIDRAKLRKITKKTISTLLSNKLVKISEEDFQSRLNAAVKAFDKLGFYPILTDEKNSYILEIRNCFCWGVMEDSPECISNVILSRFFTDSEVIDKKCEKEKRYSQIQIRPDI